MLVWKSTYLKERKRMFEIEEQLIDTEERLNLTIAALNQARLQRNQMVAEIDRGAKLIRDTASFAESLMRENELLKQRLKSAEKLCFEFPKQQQPASPISSEDITKLIKLCHPDRHGNSRLSNEVTQMLLNMRGG